MNKDTNFYLDAGAVTHPGDGTTRVVLVMKAFGAFAVLPHTLVDLLNEQVSRQGRVGHVEQTPEAP